MNGKPLQVINVGNDGKSYKLNKDVLQQILLQGDIKDRSVVVVSIAGAFRKGKSFMLAYMLRYMYATYVQQSTSDWLGKKCEKLEGFSWRSGIERDTTGIWIWSDIFLHDKSNGEKFAIILMDTQGTFDKQSSIKDNTTVFSLSMMLSSVQIINISQNIQESDMQHLQLFTEYGKMALDESSQTAFQKVLFLIRDWGNEEEFAYGLEGGKRYLKDYFKVSRYQHDDLKSVREDLKASFSEISCYLMPHPGLNVTKKNFDGRLESIKEEDFIDHLRDFVPLILAPANLIGKKINGYELKAKSFTQYVEIYLSAFQTNTLPEPKTIYKATIEVFYNELDKEMKEFIMNSMDNFERSFKNFKSEDVFKKALEDVKTNVLELFDNRKKGSLKISEKYKTQLISYTDKKITKIIARYQGAVEIFNNEFLEESRQYYLKLMGEIKEDEYVYYGQELKSMHEKVKKEVLIKFDENITGGSKVAVEEKENLEKYMNNYFKEFKVDYLDILSWGWKKFIKNIPAAAYTTIDKAGRAIDKAGTAIEKAGTAIKEFFTTVKEVYDTMEE